MKIIEDPYFKVHLLQTLRRLPAINRYLFAAILLSAVLYACGVLSWFILSIVLSVSISIKLLAYLRVMTAKRRLKKHRSQINTGD